MAVAEVAEVAEPEKNEGENVDEEPKGTDSGEAPENTEQPGEYEYEEESEEVSEDTGDEAQESTEETQKETPEESQGEETPAAEEVGLTEELLLRAQEVGLSREQAEAYQKAGLLDSTMTLYDRKLAALGHELRSSQAPQGEVANAEPKKLQAEVRTLEEVEPFKLDFGEVELDETLTANLKGLSDHVNAQLAGINTKLRAMEDAREAEIRREFLTQFDSWIGGLGEEWQDTFGKGEVTNLSETSQEVTNRRQLLQQYEDLRSTYLLRGVQPPSRDELQKRALRSAFGDKSEKLARKQILAKVKERSRQTISRPSRAGGKELSGMERAEAFVEGWFKDKNIQTDATPDEEY